MATRTRRRKDPAAATLARRRAAKLTPEQRRESAQHAARTRWGSVALGAGKPLEDISVLVGGLPDTRSAEELLEDLRSARQPRTPSA